MHDDHGKVGPKHNPYPDNSRLLDADRKGVLEFIVGVGIGMVLMVAMLGPTSSETLRKVQEENINLKQLNATLEAKWVKAQEAQERAVDILAADDEHSD